MMPVYTPGAPNQYTDAVEETPMNASLEQNYPNPFNGITNIEFSLNEPDHVTITVYTISGSVVTVLANKNFSTGKHMIQWNASGLPDGYYFYSIRTSTGTVVKKASVIK
jgi:flagellar hook assembly protein FlgD